jgi:putative membrane protein
MFVRLSGIAFALYWCALAIEPVSRADWLLENVLTLFGVLWLVRCRRDRTLSDCSIGLVLGFLVLHATGAHYTYSAVPYDVWADRHLGFTISELTGWQRNHFDRIVHFVFGVLLAYPCREYLLRRHRVRARHAAIVTLLLVMSASLLYELIEWAAAAAFGGELGTAYVGAQGDPWDAQKDMLLAIVGVLVANALYGIRRAGRITPATRPD